MHPTETLRRLGGVASWSALRRHCAQADIDRLVISGDLVRDARGRYALPGADAALRRANEVTGVLSLRSAALHHGWAVARCPDRPDITVRAGRRLRPEQRRLATFHYADLGPGDTDGLVTSRDRTLVDCLRLLPEAEALAVADSAVREGDCSPARLRALVADLRGRGAARARRVAERADGRAANPFESVLRHLTFDVPGLQVVPQLGIRESGFHARPDLVDPRLRLVIEADSHAFHSSRAQLRRDCRRYTGLVALGWVVVRFSWEDVMLDPDYVVDVLRRVVARHAVRAR